jgi:5-methylcytosine-specific restriction endonuclease McrA
MRVPAKTWREVFERDKGVCQYCEINLLGSFSSYWSATVDHVVAVAVGGGDELENLVLACPACNGMLSRSGKLKTFLERKAFVAKRTEEEMDGFNVWYKSSKNL